MLADRVEDQRRKLAKSADLHATAIFNPGVDQVSYIARDTLPFLHSRNSGMYGTGRSPWLYSTST